MKKKEIMELVEKKRKLDSTEFIQERFKRIRLYGGKWFLPDCDDLKEEFSILEKELNDNDKLIKNLRKELTQKCEHRARLKYRGHHPDYNRCAICNKIIYERNDSEWKQSSDLNNNYITFYSAIQDGEQVIGDVEIDVEGLHLVNPYYDHHILNIIEYVLKDKKDDDEIDLVKEIDKLNLPNKEVHKGKGKKDKFVLIFAGSNRIKLDDDNYIFRKPFVDSLKFVDYFLGLMNVKVCLMDNPEVIDTLPSQEQYSDSNPYFKKITYSYFQNINLYLDKIQDVDFDLIIDISELFDQYTIEDGKLKLTRTSIDFKKYFPNSKITKIKHFNPDEEKIMQEELQDENTYGVYKHVYQHNDNGEIKTFEEEEKICNKLKLTLKKK